MGETNIIRPATEMEKQDFVEIGQTNILDVFMVELAKKQTEYFKQYKPFDKYSARMDFDEYVRKVVGEIASSIDQTKVNKTLKISDLDKYGDIKRFELVNERPVFEDKLLDGIRNTVQTGKEYKYKAKPRGNFISIFVPATEVVKVDAWVKENFK